MDKTKFDKLVAGKAETEYQDKKREFSNMIRTWLSNNSAMNAHEHGSSLLHEMDQATNSMFEKRKTEIINQIQSKTIDKIMGQLDQVKFLFDEER